MGILMLRRLLRCKATTTLASTRVRRLPGHSITGQGLQPQNNSVNQNKFPQPQQPQLSSLRDSQQITFPQGLNQGSPDMFPD